MTNYLYYSKTSFPLIKGKMFSNAPNKLFSISNQIMSCIGILCILFISL